MPEEQSAPSKSEFAEQSCIANRIHTNRVPGKHTSKLRLLRQYVLVTAPRKESQDNSTLLPTCAGRSPAMATPIKEVRFWGIKDAFFLMGKKPLSKDGITGEAVCVEVSDIQSSRRSACVEIVGAMVQSG